MRKMTIEAEPFEETKEFLRPAFEHIHSYEILETLKIDYQKGLCIDLIDFHLKDDVSIHDLKHIDKMEVLSILRSNGAKHTCLVKYFEDEESMNTFQDFDMDLIDTTPAVISLDKITYSVIGENENLIKYVELVKTKVGKITNMTFKKARYQSKDILKVLTDRQRDILTTAYQFGYYDYPKKISSEKLAGRVNIGKTTMVQHLRKAEGRILIEIMTDVPKHR
jgi:predicted DNA binding protein